MKLPIADCRLPGDCQADNVVKSLAVRVRGATRPALSIENRKSKITKDSAFTLLEVMIAVVAFCIAMFAILALVANTLAGARLLQRPMVDGGAVASYLSQTNRFSEGTYQINLGDLLGKDYNGYSCRYDIEPAPDITNLFQVDITVENRSGGKPVSQMSILLFGQNALMTP